MLSAVVPTRADEPNGNFLFPDPGMAALAPGTGAFLEQDGLVVVEMESINNRPGDWLLLPDEAAQLPGGHQTFSGATGGQYLQWEGPNHFNSPGNGLLTYEVVIATPGTYRFQWRSRIGEGSNSTEHNDTWLKILADVFYGEKGNGHVVCPKGYDPAENACSGNAPEGSGKSGWFKVYLSGSTNWTWSTKTSDNDAHDLFATFDNPGTYTLLVSGRSNGHVIDRMVLHHVSAYTGNATSTSLPESPRATQVQNTPPSVVTSIPDQTLQIGSPAVTFDLSGVFADAEDAAASLLLSLPAAGDPAVVDASLSGTTLTLTPVAAGTTTLTVRATDSGGLFVDEGLTVTVSEPAASLTLPFTESWNLVGFPFATPTSFQAAFAEPAPDAGPYSFGGAYALESDLAPGNGYWLKFDQGGTATLQGTAAESVNLSLTTGWNLIAGPYCDVPLVAAQDPDGLLDPSSLFAFEGTYVATSTLEPGQGYWVKASGSGSVSLDCTGASSAPKQFATAVAQASPELSRLTQLRFRDARGAEQVLYVGASEPDRSLPPLPPAGAFDVRFAGDWRVLAGTEGTLAIQATHFPVEVELVGDETYVLETLVDASARVTYSLTANQTVQLTDPSVLQLRLRKKAPLPEQFAISGNYPNPFRHHTALALSLPEPAHVTVELFDVLGRRTRTAFDAALPAGAQQTIRIEAGTLPSGLYLYRVTARMASQTVTQTGRLTLMR